MVASGFLRSQFRTGLCTVLIMLWFVPFAALGDNSPANPVATALGHGKFPWYNAREDQVQPVKLPSQVEPMRWNLGTQWRWLDYLVFGIFVLALIGLVIIVVRFWNQFAPAPDRTLTSGQPISRAAQSDEVLPDGLRDAAVARDPWAEANRLRLVGDFAGAIISLFAYQLLTLARLNLVRLAPGRTGRQLHRSVADAEFQSLLTPTLRQFEAVYYGHRNPDAADFAVVWEAAERFQRRAAAQVTV